MTANELVLVIPRRAIMGDPGWRGMRTEGLDDFESIVAREGRFQPRAAMEVDRSWKQVIPYLVLRDGERYFLMRRTRAGGDARLHDRWSIGVGGHLNPGDGDLAGGLRREWREELRAHFDPEFPLVGLLNDDSTDVGSVHVGAVYVADAGGLPVAIREVDKLTRGGWGLVDTAYKVRQPSSTEQILHPEGLPRGRRAQASSGIRARRLPGSGKRAHDRHLGRAADARAATAGRAARRPGGAATATSCGGAGDDARPDHALALGHAARRGRVRDPGCAR